MHNYTNRVQVPLTDPEAEQLGKHSEISGLPLGRQLIELARPALMQRPKKTGNKRMGIDRKEPK